MSNSHGRRIATAAGLAVCLLATQLNADTPTWAALESAFKAAGEKIAPAVVKIVVDREPEAAVDNIYFARPDAPVSGVIVDPQGLVLTCSWNVAGTVKSIEVELADGRLYTASLVAQDGNLDLALLQLAKVEGTLPAASLDAQIQSRVGQFAIVVGRHSSLGHGVTTGIVSALRRLRGDADQLDALVGYGNAGAAVVDLHGRLLGIVSQVKGGAEQGQNSGVGFFAPVAKIVKALDRLKKGESIAKSGGGFLGVRQGDDSAMNGAVIGEVIANTAAAKAGLQTGDRVTAINGNPTPDFFVLISYLQAVSPGETVMLTIQRGDQQLEVSVTLGERPVQSE